MDQGEGGVCIEDPELVAVDGGVAAGTIPTPAPCPIDNVVMPVACSGATWPDVKLNYVAALRAGAGDADSGQQ